MYKKLHLLATAAILAVSSHAYAQAVMPISNLPTAASPLSGSEYLPCVQAGATKKCVASAVSSTVGSSPVTLKEGLTLDTQATFNLTPQSYTLVGQGVPMNVSYYLQPTPSTGNYYSLVASLTDTTSTNPGNKAAFYCAAQDGPSLSPVWGCNALVNIYHDTSSEAMEVDVNNFYSDTFAQPKNAMTIVSGGTYTGGNGLLVFAAPGAPADANFAEDIFLNGWRAGGDGLYLKRLTDTSPTGYAIRFANNAGTSNLFYVDISGDVSGANGSFTSLNVNGNVGSNLTFVTNAGVNLSDATGWTAQTHGASMLEAGTTLYIDSYSGGGIQFRGTSFASLGNIDPNGNFNGAGYIRPKQTTVAGLATLDPSPQAGDTASVSDATSGSCVANTTVVGGSNVTCAVVYSGSAWKARVTH